MNEEIEEVKEENAPEKEIKEESISQEPEQKFENAEALTSFLPEDKTIFKKNLAPKIQRHKTLMIIMISFAVVVMTGVIFSVSKSKKKKQTGVDTAGAAQAPREFLNYERDKAPHEVKIDPETGAVITEEVALPEVTPVAYGAKGDVMPPRGAAQFQNPEEPPPPPPPSGGGGAYDRSGGYTPAFTANRSQLVPPVIEGSLFARSGTGEKTQNTGRYAEQYPYAQGEPARQGASSVPAAAYSAYPSGQNDYTTQNNQSDKKEFYNQDSQSGAQTSGQYIGDNTIWIGTIIPAALETAVNTDLPGNVVARVSQNVYDSRTGRRLLIPQGTLLVAKYNSSVSYAQKRVQIVWDTLIRPDGYQVELAGMNGVDAKGMSGAEAEYHENWFEYVKAAGIISMFSIATSQMAEEANKYGGTQTAQGVVQGNAEFMQQAGGNIVGRAMNIQPTLTIAQGETVNIMVNKNVYLPPVDDAQVKKKYTLR
jgi:type IV secretion system protein VirB10